MVTEVTLNRFKLYSSITGVSCQSYDQCIVVAGTSTDKAVADLLMQYPSGDAPIDEMWQTYANYSYEHVYALEGLVVTGGGQATMTCSGAGTFTSKSSTQAIFGYFAAPGSYNCDLSVDGQTLRFTLVVGQSSGMYHVHKDDVSGTSFTMFVDTVYINGQRVSHRRNARSVAYPQSTSNSPYADTRTGEAKREAST